MTNINYIKKLAGLYSHLTAQVATKEIEQKQFDRIKNIYQEFLSIDTNASTGKIVSLFNDFNKTFTTLSNNTFNPTIKHTIFPIQKEIYNIYEKLILKKIKELHDKYLSIANETDAENIDENIKVLMSLMGEFNAAFGSLNSVEVALGNPSLKMIVNPLYKNVREMHDRIAEFYEKTGKRIEYIKYDDEDEEEDMSVKSDEELLLELKDLESEYLNIAAQSSEVNDNLNILEEIYDEMKITLSKIVKNKNKNMISAAKIIFDKVSRVHAELVGEKEKVTKAPKAKKDPQIETELRQKEKERIRGLYRNYSEKNKRALEIFNALPEEEQKARKEILYAAIKRYMATPKGIAALENKRKNEKEKRKNEQEKRKNEREKRQRLKEEKKEQKLQDLSESIKRFFSKS